MPTRTTRHPITKHYRLATALFAVLALWLGAMPGASADSRAPAPRPPSVSPAPKPEPIAVRELPVPPTAPPGDAGACTSATGCVSAVTAGGFLPDGRTVTASFTYAGAPTAPDPRSMYRGNQLALIRTDGSTFPDGKPWKCVTCGVPAANQAGASGDFRYGQPFRDGRRVLAGTGVVDCSPYRLTDPRCTPAVTRVYPVRWNVTPDGSGPGGAVMGLKVHPDNVHVGWNKVIRPTAPGDGFDEIAYFGRLRFNPHPTSGTPLAPRYDIVKVTGLYSADPALNGHFFRVDPRDPTRLRYDQQGAVGEFKNFTGDGRSLIGIGNARSVNLDHFATSLTAGKSRRLDADPGYSDPATSSPDGTWTVAMDVRYRDRFHFMAGLPGVPPLVDMLPTGAAASAGYNIRMRRLFQPFLIDRYGDRGNYHGQQINACTTGPCSTLATGPGSTADSPFWAARADSYWSPDGTQVVYGQTYSSPADCGPPFDLAACPPSSEPGGRTSRLMLAHLTSREALRLPPVRPVSDSVPWGTPYHPGDPDPKRPHLPAGRYTLDGTSAGRATVDLVENAQSTGLTRISVSYKNYSDDGKTFLNGTESVENAGAPSSPVTFHTRLRISGEHTGTRTTSEPAGYTISPLSSLQGSYQPVGTMTTVLDGRVHAQPVSYS
ncbi:hypothetical protein PYK79_16080 [Streptomyces sp. ID05-04B]|uniref:hypothetical protein n=1 Tax=Streptomyces sp. ID05-04B TaxID=3028661 RepID=UPI0029C58EC9|nr:hypothetical protein [Streptomyces sp. ID05-04B]MDX5564564.1 hypothetical protein [Streptomyces sp. ID05-04B]